MIFQGLLYHFMRLYLHLKYARYFLLLNTGVSVQCLVEYLCTKELCAIYILISVTDAEIFSTLLNKEQERDKFTEEIMKKGEATKVFYFLFFLN